MAMVIRTAFNSAGWSGRCRNAERDRRLFQCHEQIIGTEFKVSATGHCMGACWEQNLCTRYLWRKADGHFGERAAGKAYFFYRDVDNTLVLWARSSIDEVEGAQVKFRPFQPLRQSAQVRGLTYRTLERLGVPRWGSGTYRYISDEVAKTLDGLLAGHEDTLEDPSEEYWDLEGRSALRLHVRKERSRRLVAAFKAQLKSYECKVCGFSFEKQYGILGRRFIEAHHRKPISSLKEETVVSIEDLEPVCSNCHRMLHKEDPPLTTAKLSRLIKKR